MKTPKRHHELTTMEHDPSERVWDFSQEQVNAQRWKRKNRVKRLKCTIRKYKTGKGIFGAYSYLMSAYAIMLKTGELSQDASITECRGHLIYLNSIMEDLHKERERVLRRIDVLVDKACEREETEDRKEQG